MVGGTGKDDLYGGSGNDVFKLTEGSGYDRIRDFEKGEDELILQNMILMNLEFLIAARI